MAKASLYIASFIFILCFGLNQLAAQTIGQGTSIVDIETLNEAIPSKFQLSAPYPNPFNPSTNIRFATREKQDVIFTLHDMLGRKMKDLYDGPIEGNTIYTIKITATDLKSGVYLVKLEGHDFSTSRTVALIK